MHEITLDPCTVYKSSEITRLHESASANFKAGNIKESINGYLKITEIDRKNAEAYYWLGVICLQSHQANEARKFLEVAVRLDPNNQIYQRSIDELLMAEDVNKQKMTLHLSKLKSNSIKNPGNAELLLQYIEYLMAEFWFTWDVMYHLFRVQDLIPNETYPYELMAKVWRRLGNHQAAFDQAKKALSLDPDSKEGLVVAGRSMLQMKCWNEALPYLERAVQLTPSRFGVLRALGEVYLALGHYDCAKISYESALESTPDRSELIYGLGKAQVGLKNNIKAQNSFETCLARDPLHLPAALGLFKTLVKRGRLFKATGVLLHLFRGMYLNAREFESTGNSEKFINKPSVLSSFITVNLILLIRILAPVLTIRFLPINGSHIALLAGDISAYFCERQHALQPRRTLDFLYYDRPPCNLQLGRMWRRRLPIFGMAGRCDKLNMKIAGGMPHRITTQSILWHNNSDFYDLNRTTPPPISFTKKERRFGEKKLREIGIPDGAEFICFHNRDNGYVKAGIPNDRHEIPDHRNSAVRDSSVHDYLPAVRELNKQGLYAVRLGHVVSEKIPDGNDMFIDYPNFHRSEFMDVYLSSRCKFYLGDTSGITLLPVLFRNPVVAVNMIPFIQIGESEIYDVFIPKKIWSRTEARYLTFKEILGSCLSYVNQGPNFEELNLEVVNNSPDEIAGATLELAARLNGTWEPTPLDDELQKKFWALFPSAMLPHSRKRRIGAAFLRKNIDLLLINGE